MRDTRKRFADRAVGYLRVSTDEQRLGPEAQRASIEAWAKANGVQVVAWHEDHGVGGARDIDERPGLMSALADLREQRAGVLAIAKRDRIARDVAVALAIERAVAKEGARIVSADGTGNGTEPGDEFMRVVIDGAAQYERALIRARTRAALAVKRARGYRVGEVPYGYRADEDGRLHPCAEEQAVIANVARLRARGRTLREIVRACAAAGDCSRSGRPFGLTQIARILSRNPPAAGEA